MLFDEFCGGEADVWGDGDDMTPAAGRPFSRHTGDVDRLAGGDKNVRFDAESPLARDWGVVGFQRRRMVAIRRRADERFGRANQNDERTRKEIDPPLAIGSHRSCSLTSNSE